MHANEHNAVHPPVLPQPDRCTKQTSLSPQCHAGDGRPDRADSGAGGVALPLAQAARQQVHCT
jgi:hypothetical protein